MTDAEFERLSAYVDDALDASEARAVEAWLATSPEARQELVQMRSDKALLREAAAAPEPDATRLAALRRAVLDRAAAAARPARAGWLDALAALLTPRRLAALGLPAALVVAVAVMPWRVPPSQGTPTGPAGSAPTRPGASNAVPVDTPTAPGAGFTELAGGPGGAFLDFTVDPGAVTTRIPVPGMGMDVLWVMQ